MGSLEFYAISELLSVEFLRCPGSSEFACAFSACVSRDLTDSAISMSSFTVGLRLDEPKKGCFYRDFFDESKQPTTNKGSDLTNEHVFVNIAVTQRIVNQGSRALIGVCFYP